jgi:cytochrome c oxidase cbb3-type subunit 3
MKLHAIAIVAVVELTACERERRRFRLPPPSISAHTAVTDPGQPPLRGAEMSTPGPSDGNAYDVSQGAQLFGWYNCSGCHAHGGGAIGPALMDDQWRYGARPADIFDSIVEGRPNGMPSFRGKIPDNQVWQLVAFVRSLSGQLRRDVEPGRMDSMSYARPGSMSPRQPIHGERRHEMVQP